LLGEAHNRFGVVAPFGGPTSSGMLTLHCPPEEVPALAALLRERGAAAVSVVDLAYVFTRENPLSERLSAALDG
jgi:ATP phosphoribosyltransferase